MAEQAYAVDLKSSGLEPYGFKSRQLHLLHGTEGQGDGRSGEVDLALAERKLLWDGEPSGAKRAHKVILHTPGEK